MDKWVPIYCAVGVNFVTVLHNANFKFDDISFYKKNDSDRRQSISLYQCINILVGIMFFDVVTKAIYK